MSGRRLNWLREAPGWKILVIDNHDPDRTSHVIPTKRFVLRRGGYVEQPPDLEYRPTGTTLAQAVERELDAKAWAAGAVHGTSS